MDLIWGHIASICNADDSKKFANLSKVAQLILCIPHSNAIEERVFNFIKLNKTPTRSCPDSNRTLSSIATVNWLMEIFASPGNLPKLYSRHLSQQLQNIMNYIKANNFLEIACVYKYVISF